MNNKLTLLMVTMIVVSSFIIQIGCAKPQGSSPEQKREFVNGMAADTIAELYDRYPQAKSIIDNSVGYGVFSDVNTQLLYFGTGNGYGVVTDNSDGAKTYMRMGEASAGLGVALKDFREVIVFNDQEAFTNFVTEGWNIGAGAGAEATYEGSGKGSTGEVPLDSAIVVYQITESGIALRANMSASKYWIDEDLNTF